MYLFEQILPFLPAFERLGVCFKILELHIAFCQGLIEDLSESEQVQIVAAYTAMSNHEMFVAESRGLTNTSGYPSADPTYPPH